MSRNLEGILKCRVYTMEFAAPTKRTVPAMMADTRGSSTVEMENVEIYDATKTTPWERRFNPYDFNGGYVCYVLLCCYWRLISDVLKSGD